MPESTPATDPWIVAVTPWFPAAVLAVWEPWP
jgi:hypothetical protein